MDFQLRQYGPASTPEELAAMTDRVSVIGDRMLLLHELPVQSPFSINVMFDRVEEYARDWPRFGYVVDLTDARRPDSETRAALRTRVARLGPRLTHVAIVVGNNLIMRAMARLMAHGMGLSSVSTHATRPEAIEGAWSEVGRQ